MLKTNFELRDYQKSFINNIRSSILKDRRVIACAATGSGKTKVFCTIAVNAINKGKTVLILSESRKLFKQIGRDISSIEIKAGSDLRYIMPGSLYLAMAQTLALREYLIEKFKELDSKLLIICDEAHIGTATKILLQLSHALLIGFTATPDGSTAKHLVKLYNNIVIGPQAHDLVLQGFLTPCRHFARRKANLSSLEIKGGEYTEESQERVFETRVVYDGIIEDLKTVPFKKCLIFTASIKHCNDVVKELRENSLSCVPVHSGLSNAEENYNLYLFMNDLMPICVSVGILTKGFDFEEIDLIALLRATTSLALYNQMLGRGSRLSEGKKWFTVLDYGGNYLRHDLWDYEHDWASMWNQTKKKKKKGVAPVKSCPKCEYIVSVNTVKCPNCGHIFINEEDKKSKEETELVEINKQYQSLVGRKISSLSAYELAAYVKMKGKKLYGIRVAQAKEQEQEGFLNLYAKAMGYKPAWVWEQHKQMNREDEMGRQKKIEFQDFVLR